MTNRKTMNVSLTPELERLVAEKVASGRYRTASEVVRAALRLLEKSDEISTPLALGVESAGPGDGC
jgi:antitoxin ParD1/3/4